MKYGSVLTKAKSTSKERMKTEITSRSLRTKAMAYVTADKPQLKLNHPQPAMFVSGDVKGWCLSKILSVISN